MLFNVPQKTRAQRRGQRVDVNARLKKAKNQTTIMQIIVF
jgi:hypothetical protein